jgi:sodium-dependent dicarboxylate transporter 2/3/5
MAIFITAFLGWAILGHIVGLAVIAMAVAVMLFLTKSISWRDAEKKLPWSIIFLYGGAITIGKALSDTGGAKFLADNAIGIAGGSPYLMILIIILATKVLTELMSNAAATAVILPIALTTMQEINYPPMVAVFVVTLSSGLAFMLPISTPGNAIVYSSGYISIRDLLKAGFWLDLIGIIVFMTIGLAYWKLIGIF